MLEKLKTKLSEKQHKFLLVDCTRPVGQVILKLCSSKIKTYSSQMSGRVEVFCPELALDFGWLLTGDSTVCMFVPM